MILITGCSRAGSVFTHRVLQQLGLHQVRHPLKNIESLTTMKYWDHSNRGMNMPAGPSIEYVSPLDVDPSLKHDNLILQCARYYFLYNSVAEANSQYTFQAEKLLSDDSVFDEVCKRTGVTKLPKEIDVPKNANSRKHVSSRKSVSWEILESLDSQLTYNLKQMADRWGYGDE